MVSRWHSKSRAIATPFENIRHATSNMICRQIDPDALPLFVDDCVPPPIMEFRRFDQIERAEIQFLY
jgi:hypothetical protein